MPYFLCFCSEGVIESPWLMVSPISLLLPGVFVQQQKLRTMNICPDLRRKLCLCVCVCLQESWRELSIDALSVDTWGFTETWKSVLGWCQTLQPACCFSPPCGCFPIHQGNPRYSCKLMQVFSLHGHCSNGCTLNNAHNNRKAIAFTELSLPCNSCTAFSCLCHPRPSPLVRRGGVTEAEETVSLSSSSLRREEKPRMGFWECGRLCSI